MNHKNKDDILKELFEKSGLFTENIESDYNVNAFPEIVSNITEHIIIVVGKKRDIQKLGLKEKKHYQRKFIAEEEYLENPNSKEQEFDNIILRLDELNDFFYSIYTAEEIFEDEEIYNYSEYLNLDEKELKERVEKGEITEEEYKEIKDVKDIYTKNLVAASKYIDNHRQFLFQLLDYLSKGNEEIIDTLLLGMRAEDATISPISKSLLGVAIYEILMGAGNVKIFLKLKQPMNGKTIIPIEDLIEFDEDILILEEAINEVLQQEISNIKFKLFVYPGGKYTLDDLIKELERKM